MKKHLILSSLILVALFGFATKTFATTATPAITTIAGDASSGTVYINTAEKAGIIVVGTITASTSASTTIWTVFKDGTTNYATTTGLASDGTFTVTTTNGSSLADGTGISLWVYAQTGEDATSTAATKTSIKLDTVVPTLSKITMYTSNSSTTIAKVGDIVYLTATSSEVIGSPTVTLLGHSGSAVTVSNIADNGWMASTTMISSDASGIATLNVSFNDLAGNAGISTTTLNNGILSYYYTAPTISIIGYNPLKCNIHWTCADQSATAVDSRGVSVTLSTLSNVSTSTAGNYTVRYGGVDLAGNAATSTRNVYIVTPGRVNSGVDNTTDTVDTVVTTTTTTTTDNSSSGNTTTVTTNPVTTQVSTSNEVPITVIKVSGIKNTVKRQLLYGRSGVDVKLVQTILSSDPTIYPEGLKTGYFGSLTRSAVQRFQEKYNIASVGTPGYGEVGPRTKAKLIEIYGQ